MPASLPEAQRSRTEIIAFAGAGGGVGRTSLVVNVAVYLHRRGMPCLVADLDVAHPATSEYLGRAAGGSSGMATSHETLDGALAGLSRTDPPVWAPPAEVVRDPSRLKPELERLRPVSSKGPERVVIDTPSGVDPVALEALARADIPVIVLRPDPASVATAYRLIASAFAVRLKNRLTHPQADRNGRAWLAEAEKALALEPFVTPIQYVGLSAVDRNIAALVSDTLAGYRPYLAVNESFERDDAVLGDEMARVARQIMGVEAVVLPVLPRDDTALLASRRRRPVLLEHPDARLSVALRGLTAALLQPTG
jgi:flagellar biosynthesis protein FlhG